MPSFNMRTIFDSGDEPFSEILEAASDLRPNETLEIVMPYQSMPLYNHMERLGYDRSVQRIEGNGWKITFKRISEQNEAPAC